MKAHLATFAALALAYSAGAAFKELKTDIDGYTPLVSEANYTLFTTGPLNKVAHDTFYAMQAAMYDRIGGSVANAATNSVWYATKSGGVCDIKAFLESEREISGYSVSPLMVASTNANNGSAYLASFKVPGYCDYTGDTFFFGDYVKNASFLPEQPSPTGAASFKADVDTLLEWVFPEAGLEATRIDLGAMVPSCGSVFKRYYQKFKSSERRPLVGGFIPAEAQIVGQLGMRAAIYNTKAPPISSYKMKRRNYRWSGRFNVYPTYYDEQGSSYSPTGNETGVVVTATLEDVSVSAVTSEVDVACSDQSQGLQIVQSRKQTRNGRGTGIVVTLNAIPNGLSAPVFYPDFELGSNERAAVEFSYEIWTQGATGEVSAAEEDYFYKDGSMTKRTFETNDVYYLPHVARFYAMTYTNGSADVRQTLFYRDFYESGVKGTEDYADDIKSYADVTMPEYSIDMSSPSYVIPVGWSWGTPVPEWWVAIPTNGTAEEGIWYKYSENGERIFITEEQRTTGWNAGWNGHLNPLGFRSDEYKTNQIRSAYMVILDYGSGNGNLYTDALDE